MSLLLEWPKPRSISSIVEFDTDSCDLLPRWRDYQDRASHLELDLLLLAQAYSGRWPVDHAIAPSRAGDSKSRSARSFRRSSDRTPLTEWLGRMPFIALPRAALPAPLALNRQPRGLVLAA